MTRLRTLPGQTIDLLLSWKFWKELVLMTVAMFISAMAIHFFLKPSGMIVGSITGLSIVVGKIIPFFSFGSIMMTINAILLILSFILIGNEFGAKTVYTAMILGPFTDLMDYIDPSHVDLGTSLMQDPWFDLLCFVLVLSAAQSILFSINASTGGLDILAKIFNKYLHIPLGISVTVAGGLICCTAFVTSPVNLVVMGLVGTWINGLILDYFMGRMNSRTRVHIICDQWKLIQDFVIRDINRGVTLHHVTGGYSGRDYVQLECILTRDEFGKLNDFIRSQQLNPFITADPVSEVYGIWRSKRQSMPEAPHLEGRKGRSSGPTPNDDTF